jgi:hypothetical protein
MNSKSKSVIAAVLLAALLAVPVSAAQRTKDGDQTTGSFISKVIKQIRRFLPAMATDDIGGPKP